MSLNRFESRRSFLQQNALGVGSVALAWLLREENLLATPPAVPRQLQTFDMKPKQTHREGRARAMISLFMHGGPSHVDLFDPKQELSKRSGEDYPGEITYSFVDRPAKSFSAVRGSSSRKALAAPKSLNSCPISPRSWMKCASSAPCTRISTGMNRRFGP